jgi:hypothetical protein
MILFKAFRRSLGGDFSGEVTFNTEMESGLIYNLRGNKISYE